MKKIYYRKLIRDRIPDVMRAKGKSFSVRALDRATFERELLKKVEEEASALSNVKTRAELIDELVDVMDVVDEVRRVKKISTQAIKKKQREHRATKGGFKKKYFLVWSQDDGYKTNEKRANTKNRSRRRAK
jgi:predicted house-cleaning noncanonical NTP pyrophosphatase (MazG superfamily)